MSAFHPYIRPTLVPSMSDASPFRKVYKESEDLAALDEYAKALRLAVPMQQTPSTPLAVLPAVSVERGRRKRTTFSPDQAARLEMEYLADCYMARDKRMSLAVALNLTENQVKTWFQNRRAKDKRDKRTDGLCTPSSCSRKSSISPTMPMPHTSVLTPPFCTPPKPGLDALVSPAGTSSLLLTTPLMTSPPLASTSCATTPNDPKTPLDLPPTPPLKNAGALLHDYVQYLATFGLNINSPLLMSPSLQLTSPQQNNQLLASPLLPQLPTANFI
ncbi:unnamed protein product [Caenorhabditis auriculariae]|uniref:Homeobox domain-containing protein n=1 Tax=Caenorhabditis auriculariae TaxID=2777116 RepID=A0A8S1HMS3_9PELO|nr:unnamed protein product [Caenorhabditis auriculariae]